MITHVDDIAKFSLAQYIVKVNEFCEHFIIYYNRTIELLIITHQFLLPFELILWEKTNILFFFQKCYIVQYTLNRETSEKQLLNKSL